MVYPLAISLSTADRRTSQGAAFTAWHKKEHAETNYLRRDDGIHCELTQKL